MFKRNKKKEKKRLQMLYVFTEIFAANKNKFDSDIKRILFIAIFQISIGELSSATGSMLIYLKGFNFKLCRKGLLERGMSIGKWFGNFKELENQHLIDISLPNANIADLTADLKKKKAVVVKKEVNQLKVELKNLGKTIENKKREIQRRTDEYTYNKWSQHIRGRS